MHCTLVIIFALNIVLITATKHCQPGGQFGPNCERNCSCNCALYRAVKRCEKADGECSEGCVSGWYGDQCDQPCSKTCVNHICNQHNGHCTKGCQGNFTGDYCNITAPLHNSNENKVSCRCEGDSHYSTILALSIFSGITGTAAIVFIGLFVKLKFFDNRGGTPQPNTPENNRLTDM